MLYDITPTVSPTLGVWPGDTPPTRNVLLDTAEGHNITLSSLTSTVHLGAHADAPSHYGLVAAGARTIEAQPLERYWGEALVVHAPCPRGTRLTLAALDAAIDAVLERVLPPGSPGSLAPERFSGRPGATPPGVTRSLPPPRPLPPRVLIATGTFPDPDHWNNDFAALEPAIVDALADRGVVLIGLDTPSVDLIDSKDLPTHRRFLARDVSILEGLVLAGVPAGAYELSALPLKLAGFDASPVRAVLRTL